MNAKEEPNQKMVLQIDKKQPTYRVAYKFQTRPVIEHKLYKNDSSWRE
jgi:hypothetical protein